MGTRHRSRPARRTAPLRNPSRHRPRRACVPPARARRVREALEPWIRRATSFASSPTSGSRWPWWSPPAG